MGFKLKSLIKQVCGQLLEKLQDLRIIIKRLSKTPEEVSVELSLYSFIQHIKTGTIQLKVFHGGIHAYHECNLQIHLAQEFWNVFYEEI